MIQLSLLCSIDSFLAAAALTLAGCPAGYRRRIVFGFIACDSLAAMAGALTHAALPALAVWLTLTAGLTLLITAKKMPALYLLIPVLLSLDNFAAGGHRPQRHRGLTDFLDGPSFPLRGGSKQFQRFVAQRLQRPQRFAACQP